MSQSNKLQTYVVYVRYNDYEVHSMNFEIKSSFFVQKWG